jgi:ABC-type multidrug transport system fused ATPase/permease subunit
VRTRAPSRPVSRVPRVPRLGTRTARTVLAHPSLGLAIVIGSLMHASGHAALAAAGGVLARTLAGGAGPMDAGSSRILHTLGHGDPMLGLAIAGLIAAMAKLCGGVAAGWAEARVAGEVGAELRLEVLDGIHGLTRLRAPRQRDHGQAHRASSSAVDARGDMGGGANIAHLASLTTHVSDVEKAITHGVFASHRAVLQLVPLVVLLAVLAPRLAGSAALALVAFGFLVTAARRALKRNHARAARETEALLGAADEAVRHADLWRTYGAEGRIRAHVASLGRTIIATSARLRSRSALLSGTSEVLGALALVLTLALASAGAIGGVDRGAIVPFAIAFFMAYKPLRELVEARLVRARAEEILESTPAFAPAFASASASAPAWSLAPLTITALRGLHGRHAPLSLRLPAGHIAAIVGPTGIGKTSLLRALLGLDPAAGGDVTWGDVSLSARGVGPRERPFAWVPQDAPILGDTLVANVSLGARGDDGVAVGVGVGVGKDPADRMHTAYVLETLGAEGLASSLGDAVLATERSVSGGERQWIAVARALATELPVLLLDEPTSSLDGAAQERMLAAIAGLRGKRTVVIVTHRPEPLAIADVVVRLDRQSHRDDAQHGTRGDDDALGAQELAVEDVGSVAVVLDATEAQLHASRERVDVPRAE